MSLRDEDGATKRMGYIEGYLQAKKGMVNEDKQTN